jgi:DNA-binding protein HU-beta
MNKRELVLTVAKETGLNKRDIERVIKALVDSIESSLVKGNKVILVGFGTFSVVKRKSRIIRNPKTGETIKIPDRKIPKFVASKVLKGETR